MFYAFARVSKYPNQNSRRTKHHMFIASNSSYCPLICHFCGKANHTHYGDVIMGTMASQITSLTIVYSTVYSDADQRKHQSSALLAFVRGIHWGPVNSPHKWPVTRKMFPFDDVIMKLERSMDVIITRNTKRLFLQKQSLRIRCDNYISSYKNTERHTADTIVS